MAMRFGVQFFPDVAPVQRPRRKFYVAALNTPESFEFAGRMAMR
ncbi:MAG TPA: hypothetical protein VMB84_02095 [Stellaceae bacterium]|nr:hypothetical protein [Stellaceae bacterium]